MTLNDMFAENMVQPDSETERTCGTCGERKEFDQFYRDGSGPGGVPKYRRDCKDCYRVARLKTRNANKPKPAPARGRRR